MDLFQKNIILNSYDIFTQSVMQQEISTPPTMMSFMIDKVRQSERNGETVGPSESISNANELLDELEVTNMKEEIGL